MRFSARIATVVFAACALSGIACGCGRAFDSSPDILPHLISAGEAESSPVRFIDGLDAVELTSTDFRERVDELYSVVVYDGKRPLFSDDDPVKVVYDNAVAVLDRYILNSWQGSAEGEYNTVHAIHDWLACNITYDFELYSSFQAGNTDLGNNAAFFIDGVFLNGVAVCDGLARAFDFLCAIEGIQSVRVTGSFSSAPHAWNKVKVGGEWYNVDVTSDSSYYTVGGEFKKQLSHGYFLLSDRTISEFAPNGHVFTDPPQPAQFDYDYFSHAVVTVGQTYSAVVKSQAELERIFSEVNDADGAVGKLELKLDFDGKIMVNYADMYESEIARAYSLVDDPDFSFGSGAKPYFRYPNGVYLFLIYK